MIYLGADHGGFELKEKVKTWLIEWNMPFEDCGAKVLEPNDDYPDFAKEVARKVATDPDAKGILICRSGSGMVIAANKIKGARASLILDERSARHARTNDDANIASLAGDWISEENAKVAVRTFLSTPFSMEERHVRRIHKIEVV